MAQNLESLRARIAELEKRPPLGEGVAALRQNERKRGGPLAVPPGLLGEIFTDETRDGGAALGFALGAARGLLTPERPAILVMQLGRDTQETGVPYGAGLHSFGVDPEAVVLARAETITELLWAIEEAVACRAVAAVVADIAGHHKALDFTASRRLSLRAQAAGGAVFLVRYGREREASAAWLRWRVLPAPSGVAPFDPRAPGPPRFAVTLEKGRLRGLPAEARLIIEWTEHGFAFVDDGKSDGVAHRGGPAPLPGAEPAALGDRLSQAG
jgi:protein ImuA